MRASGSKDGQGQGMAETRIRAVLYVRVSTDEQVQHGYSIPEQKRELRAHADREGWQVVDEIVDDGYSGAVGIRPGLARVTALAETREIDVVLAKKRNRFFRDRFLRMGWDRSLREHGVRLVALDDTGNRFGDAMTDEFGDWYREEVTANTKAGRMEKARSGKLVASVRPTYGFAYDADRTGYVVVPHEMAVVRRVIEAIADGASIKGARAMLEGENVPAPMGGVRWSERTVRTFVFNDVYRPHPYADIAPLLTDEARARLDAQGEYGISWYPKMSSVLMDPDPARGFRRPRKESRYPRDEQVPVPVAASGIPAELIDAARARLAGNVVSRTTSGRVFPLQGILTCDGCGNNISSNRKTSATGKSYFYYRCQHHQRRGHKVCGMNRSFRADVLEDTVLRAVLDAVKDRTALIEKANAAFERERDNILRVGGADVAAWRGALDGLDAKKRRAQHAYMDGLFSADDLRARTDELDRERAHVERLLAEHEDRARKLAELEAARDKAIEQIKSGAWAELGITAPDARKERYREIGLNGELRADGTVVLRWGMAGEKVVGAPEPRR